MSWIRPVKEKVTGNFASHQKRKSVNPGVDYGTKVGTPVLAIGDGVVNRVSHTVSGAGGRVVLLDFPSGHKADYLHLSEVHVTKGQQVKVGDVLGLSGASGLGKENGYAPHLHLSFRQGGTHLQGTGNIDYEAFIGESPAPAKSTPAKAATTKAKTSRAIIRRGSRGEDVAYMQGKLNLKTDGIFGPHTHWAVIDFQKDNGLKADGIVGPITWKAIG